MVKFQEDLRTEWDGTVRNVSGEVVLFSYCSALDPSRLVVIRCKMP